ncbi:MAG: glutamate synthase large subunit [Bacteroidales bacterium OttesenSCG-928-I14]|jgi:glutamate synthase (NADPH/NADH) large chain|nr:glutamate synthase large subunit [Bacteroidales bacterium OttesenSCG-928-I14]
MEGIGLYHPSYEHGSCGVGLIVDICGNRSHDIIENGLRVLEHMRHRGAEGADNNTGDGAGITIQIPHEFILLQGIPVPEKGKYGTGLVFFSRNEKKASFCMLLLKNVIEQEGLKLLTVRSVPVNSDVLGKISRLSEPTIKQIFIIGEDSQEILERKLYIIRRKVENQIFKLSVEERESFYIVSLSTRRVIYKGMLSSVQLRNYFSDLTNQYFTSSLALVHSRYSTNTFPRWDLAQPFRLLGHNGEINTIRGNRCWMKARESLLKVPDFGKMEDIFPVIQEDMSDSASLDNVLEFLIMSGKSFPYALSMLIPESWNKKNPISNELKAFYEYNSIIMEAWDGPATLMFTDGRYAGGMLDRNGLRPARYLITKNGIIVVSSESGVLPFDPIEIKEKGRLHPGKMLLVDTLGGKIYYDSELKAELATMYPYEEWVNKNRVVLNKISSGRVVEYGIDNLIVYLKAFGYTKEDIDKIIVPMAIEGKEPIGSMGNDAPLAVLSDKPQRFFNYFRQLFAQVTNPPIDSLREELVMSLSSYIGRQCTNVLSPTSELSRMVKLQTPIITNRDLDILMNLSYKGFKSLSIPILFNITNKKDFTQSLLEALNSICYQVEKAVDEGYHYVILSDKKINENFAAIPSLLAVSSVHHYLIDKRKRMQIAIVVETADSCEVNHFALLCGFGATAINPYAVFAILYEKTSTCEIQLDYYTAEKNYIKSVSKGLLKVLSKMGISTLNSYRGAKIFETIGISQKILDSYFGGMRSSIGGIDLYDIACDILSFHNNAFMKQKTNDLKSFSSATYQLDNSGFYSFRKRGELHAWNPETISKLQVAVRTGDYMKFKEYTHFVDENLHPIFIRDFMIYKRAPIDISEVESVESITRRFVTGAMSFGSISKKVHEYIAIALNMLGGRSNTGEGGEDPVRFKICEDGLNRRSAIKQVASGRFGVTVEYLVNADELQIKIAQGAKPGEGGQLPGFKIDEIIAKIRHSTPGITLISPPPHHDIYSIEDLAQLIFDLRNINPNACISVKLVSEAGIGTIAAGVTKAKADLIIISGSDGGTGASPLSSVKHAGVPWEFGLAETQQTLVANNLRGFVRLQVDGQLKTGKDVIIAAMLGAEEYGFATSALIALGCVMMRKCHLNTCPVGIATQNEVLQKRFRGKFKYLVHFFTFLAKEVREHLSQIGYRSLNEIIGRSDLIDIRKLNTNTKSKKIDFSKLIKFVGNGNDIRYIKQFDNNIKNVLDRKIIYKAKRAIEELHPVVIDMPICNIDRSVGGMLSGEIAKRYGNVGLHDNTIIVNFSGSAGQSFGAFLIFGVSFYLEGEANDYLGKGLSGGRISLVPPKGVSFIPEKNIIGGNTLLYGATSGEVYINGQVGERFCVRNSGAIAVVEGTGDHCCEYMTGGKTVVLGKTGKNFAAGMSGGIAYVLDIDGSFDYFCNMEMVELTLMEDKLDILELKCLIEKHFYYTKSPFAKCILNEWENYLKHFIKITPIEYKRILHEKKMEEIKKKIMMVESDY